jgi:hypothetical protein
MRRSVAGLCVLAAALLASPQVMAARPADLGRLHVLLLNGGGNPEENFKSHLLHVQEMTTVLLGRGLDAERLTVMASDGQNARPDVAVRQNDPETFWLLEGTGLERALREPITYENTTIPGAGGKPVPVSPATRASVSRFFQAARARMRPGDTLLVYVTDHGKDHPRDPRLNHITLWGRGEGLTVRQLAGELERLPPGVRVVTLMSQCFSGGFAHLMDVRRRAGLPSGAACGYFATTADRPAYGCYPEANSLDRSGHAFAVLNALRTTGSLPAAHNLVLLRDQTPDVPLRTVDAFLAERLRRAARAAGTDEQSFADLQLKQSPAQERSPEWKLALQVAEAFGLPPPTDLGSLQRTAEDLDRELRRLHDHHELWQTALSDMTRAHLQRFLSAQPEWQARLRPRALRGLTEQTRRELVRQLLKALGKFADTQATDRRRLEQLRERVEEATASAHRHEVRGAAALRLRTLLTTTAGRSWLARSGSPAERAALEALETCEDLRLPPPPPQIQKQALPPPRPFPALDEDQALAARLRPSWLGIAFSNVHPGTRARVRVGEGAALVTAVQPGSPAQTGGLRAGDIVVGPPDAPFERPGQIRSFTMLSPRNRPLALEVIRKGARKQLRLTLAAVPDRE